MPRFEPPLADVLNVVVRAAIPLAGALFLGWNAGNLLFVYCADTLASVYAVCVLVCARLFGIDAGTGPAWWRRLSFGAQLALTSLLPWIVIALPLAVSMGIVLTLAQFDWNQALHDRRLWLAVLAQFGAAIGVLLRDYDAWLTEPGVDWRIRRRFGLVLLRWVIVLVAAWSVLAVFPFYAVALVAVCTLATIALELYPNRVLRAFNAPDLAVPRSAQDSTRSARSRR